MGKELFRNSCQLGGAKADRVGHAVVHGHAVVCITRRKIEHVPGAELPFVLRVEPREELQRCASYQLKSLLGADPPAAMPAPLQQKHVIGIAMRADSAARRGIAHHQIVQPRIRNEAEPFQQRIFLRKQMVHILHQQRPTPRTQIAEETWFERTMMYFPFPCMSHNDARLRIVAAGQVHEVPWSEQALEALDSAANQQRSPVANSRARKRVARVLLAGRWREVDRHASIIAALRRP